MALNKLIDLNNHLFAQLERLSDEDLTPDELKKEVSRSKAINGIASNIINNAKVGLEASKFTYDKMPNEGSLPIQFRIKEDEKH